MRTPHWTTRLELVLAEPSALRRSRYGVGHPRGKGCASRYFQSQRGALDPRSSGRRPSAASVARGLFLNRLIAPPTQLCEAAVWLRPGSVISLQAVLGDSGVWNNYTRWVTAVVPVVSRYTTPSLGDRSMTTGSSLGRATDFSIRIGTINPDNICPVCNGAGQSVTCAAQRPDDGGPSMQ
jgi:hypothetical protein